jgi:hypothetical protein
MPRCLNVTDSARFLGIATRSLYRLVERGELRPVRLPGLRKWVFDVVDLTAIVERSK